MKKLILILIIAAFPLMIVAEGDQLGNTIYRFDARYIVYQLDRLTKLVLDSATGMLYVAKRDRRGLSGGRIYDLNKIYEEYGKKEKIPLISPATKFDDLTVHGRYKADTGEAEGGDLTFYDSLNGRLWLCRYKTGSLDQWRCYSVAELVKKVEKEEKTGEE